MSERCKIVLAFNGRPECIGDAVCSVIGKPADGLRFGGSSMIPIFQVSVQTPLGQKRSLQPRPRIAAMRGGGGHGDPQL